MIRVRGSDLDRKAFYEIIYTEKRRRRKKGPNISMKYYILLLPLFLCFFLSAKPGKKSVQTVEQTLAAVEGEMISLMDLRETQQRLKKGFLDDSLLLPLFKKSRLSATNTVLLEFMIYEKLLEISAAQNQLQVEESHLKQELTRQRKNKGLSKKAFSRLLVKNHFTPSSYKEFLKKSILRKLFVQREIVEKIRISDQDLNEYALQKQGEALFTSFEYEMAYLLFPRTKMGAKKAQKTFQWISKDSAFFDEWKPRQKGEKKNILKKLKLSSLHPSIRKEIKKLSPGQISPVLSLPTGYHIFKALWKTPVITIQNQKRKEQLSALLFKELFVQKLKAWLEARKNKAFIQNQLAKKMHHKKTGSGKSF